MSKESLNAFKARLAEDEALRREVTNTFGGGDTKAVTSADRLVAFARERGYDFSADELRGSVELSAGELESVTGGAIELGSLKAGATEVLHKNKPIDILSWSFGAS